MFKKICYFIDKLDDKLMDFINKLDLKCCLCIFFCLFFSIIFSQFTNKYNMQFIDKIFMIHSFIFFQISYREFIKNYTRKK